MSNIEKLKYVWLDGTIIYYIDPVYYFNIPNLYLNISTSFNISTNTSFNISTNTSFNISDIRYQDGYINYNKDNFSDFLYPHNNKILHNPDGPAVIYKDGRVEYWLFGEKYNSLEEIILKNIIE